MSPATLAARLLRRGASSSSSPLRALTRRALHSSGPAPLARRLPAAPSSAAHWTAARRFSASQSPASSSKGSADENLRRVIESEIECVVQSEESTADKAIDLPDDFPFEIIDNAGDQSITLKREFAGETIKAAVYTNFDTEEELNEDDENDNDEESFKPAIQMVVTVQKAEGPILEFDCNFNDDELAIENFRMLNRDNPDAEHMYEGPPFSVLDESLQKGLHRYLEERGIKQSLHDWLYEYMMHKDEKEYVVWLKNMKEFIGN
ncbi:hypothetical protein PR202_gb17064 [Eleusine coracana subsp. coracana]|uniref:Mitochondrial glycoprotein n=1 Tax=Eleusine coracana subsp. coracana TaxID=191504 RepID=A0AAV5F1G0_ELECO|nr:hypothetical protein QOZ80_6BG0471460 [Eleusine coracana subsp. coracana]GJN28892.1 hypothetical protein PR202_gb17064 [Eleusine coracana subsp. coracana]